MIRKYISIYALLLSTLLLWQCEPKVDSFTPSSGSADFSTFVTIGDSYTAGYTDGALGKRGQMESFSFILSEQLAHTGSNGFNQPLVKSDGSVGTTVLAPNQNNGYFELQIQNGSLAPTPTMGDMAIFAERVYSASNQNFGVPGAKLIHLGELPPPYPPYAQLNPFYARFASAPDATIIGDALAAQPTFVSLWIGNNDALGYALAGGEEGSEELTNPVMFAGVLAQIVGAIKSTGADIVIGNLPNVDAIPYFNYILSSGHIPFVIEDEGSIRRLLEGEKVLLSASTALGMGYGQSAEMPLPGKYVLDMDELDALENANKAYNDAISAIATEEGLALADLSSLMDELKNGLVLDGNRYSDTFVTGGVFSLDGIHATGRGSAIIANAFIEAINKKFGAQVPMANINDYKTVEFP